VKDPYMISRHNYFLDIFSIWLVESKDVKPIDLESRLCVGVFYA
jgi:hypothetical protein